MTTEALPAASEAARPRRPRGQYPKKAEHSTELVEKRLPEYIEAHEVNALLRAAPNPRARLLMMIEWCAGIALGLFGCFFMPNVVFFRKHTLFFHLT